MTTPEIEREAYLITAELVGITDIVAIMAAIQAVLEMVAQCREGRGRARRSWASIRQEGRDTEGVTRIHRRLQRRIGLATMRRLGGKEFTRTLIRRGHAKRNAEIESLVREAQANA